MNYELVIFDCDGVLVDSESIVCRVIAEEMQAIGLETTVEEVDRRFTGRTAEDCLLEIEKEFGGPLPANYFDNCERRIRELFHRDLEPIAGIQELLEHLTETATPVCVASSGSHEKMRLTLGKTNLLSYFNGHVFSAEDVGRGKPWPDLFLFAAKKFQVEPSRCLVIEDSVPGVKAAVAAGMKVIGYAADLHRVKPLENAGAKVVLDLSSISALL